jgi:hypothetical protein
MRKTKTERGFALYQFTDMHEAKCSLQKSSLATDDAVWLGVDEPELFIHDKDDNTKFVVMSLPENVSAKSRMHLSRSQVKELLPILKTFSKTGEL